ncbi:MAG: glycerol-3-phosphate 1-O-acyltransferase PlsY [Amylibacter sp.]|nr:glycerol-3-phosphate 1-O-acyltransferase PlsY [Amylibacter sp.]
MPEIDITLMQGLMVAVCGYLLGSIPFGMVVAQIMGLGNLRDIGSGNIGATNVLRTGNKLAAFLTLVFDAGKGAIAVLIARALFGEAAAQIAGLAAFLGHLFPVWLKFKGGKGVATFLGMLLALTFPIGVAACMTWLGAAIVLRMSSAAALISAAPVPIWCFFLGYPAGIALTIVFAVLIWWSHRTNIARIIARSEPKIGKKG